MVMDLISLDYDDTIMAAAGHQAESALADTIEKYKGNYIVAVEGNIPLGQDGVFCIPGGETFLNKIKHVCHDAKAVIGWGSCAAWGCVQAAKPNPTKSVPITEVITDKPVVLVPGCPPIPEVMTAVITYILTYDRLPPLDRLGRPKMFYGQRIHDKCYRRAHFDAGQFVEKFEIIFQPRRKRDVPTSPKFRNCCRLIRRIEVYIETETQQQGYTDRHIRIARKVTIYLFLQFFQALSH